MIGMGFDGVLVGFDNAVVNLGLLNLLMGQEIAVITNQSGLAWGVHHLVTRGNMDRKMPLPAEFLFRFAMVNHYAKAMRVKIKHLRVCVYHPRLDQYYLDVAMHDLVDTLQMMSDTEQINCQWGVFNIQAARKPNPSIAHGIRLTEFWGFKDDDAEFATNMGVKYRFMEEFKGEKRSEENLNGVRSYFDRYLAKSGANSERVEPPVGWTSDRYRGILSSLVVHHSGNILPEETSNGMGGDRYATDKEASPDPTYTRRLYDATYPGSGGTEPTPDEA